MPDRMPKQSAQGPWQPPTKEEVRKAIESSGYPLEMKVAVGFEEAGFGCTPSWTFFDARANKPQELDAVAEGHFSEKGLTVRLHFVVECKRWRCGMVLFDFGAREEDVDVEFDLPDYMWSHFWGQPSDILDESVKSQRAHLGYPTPIAVRWGSERWPPAPDFCTQVALVKESTKNNQRIIVDQTEAHDTLDKLAQGLLLHRRRFGRVADSYKKPYLNFGVPLLVVDGPIYIHRSRGRGRRSSFTRVRHASLLRRSADPHEQRSVRIDVINVKLLRAYLDRLAADARSAADALASDLAHVQKSVEFFPFEPREHKGGAG